MATASLCYAANDATLASDFSHAVAWNDGCISRLQSAQPEIHGCRAIPH